MNRSRLVSTMVLAATLTSQILIADEKSAPPAPDPQLIRQLIVELDSDNFKVRQNATRRLSDMGRPAIGPVAEAVGTGSLEVVARAMTILEKVYRNGDDETIDAVEAVLEKLGQHTNQSVAGRAEVVLAKCYPVRERRALAEIRKAGGVFVREVNSRESVVTEVTGLSYPGLLLHIGENWTAGEDGLRHIKRLTRLENLRFVPGVSGVSREAMRAMAAAMPDLKIHERGAAKLGLTGQPSQAPRGCEILRIEPGSAAEEVKLEPGDVIVKFEDKPVVDFDSLVEMIKGKKPGDKVTLEVRSPRDPESRTVSPVLKGWQP